jgi:hypothetical protein
MLTESRNNLLTTQMRIAKTGCTYYKTRKNQWICDEDIINMDTSTVVVYNLKVKLFFSIIIFNTCVEWTLHHDMCSMSFTIVFIWIQKGVDHAWKGWIMKHLD